MRDLLMIFVSGVFGYAIAEILHGLNPRFTLRRWGRFLRSRLFSKSPQIVTECVSVGYLQTNTFLIQGDGNHKYTTDSLTAIYTDGAPTSPPDIAKRILAKERELEDDRQTGRMNVWRGLGVGISDYSTYLTDDEAHLGLQISFYKTTYPAFQGTVLAIGSEDKMQKDSIFQLHLRDRDPREIVPYLARHVGVVSVVLTADDLMVVSRRRQQVAARPGQYDVSVVEGIEPTKDAYIVGSLTRISVFDAIARGCREELGIMPDSTDISILGFGVDLNFYQYNFFSVVRTDRNFSELQKYRNGRARDAWESDIIPLKNNVDSVLSFIDKSEMWDTAVVSLYLALVHQFSHTAVDGRAAQILNPLQK